MPVSYSEKESTKVSGLALKEGLKRDRAAVANLAKFDRKAEQAKQDKSLLQLSEKANVACRVLVPMNVDWASIDDQTLQSKSISDYCGAPLQRLFRPCKDPASAVLVGKTIETATCRFGPALKLRVEGARLPGRPIVRR